MRFDDEDDGQGSNRDCDNYKLNDDVTLFYAVLFNLMQLVEKRFSSSTNKTNRMAEKMNIFD